MTLDAAARSLLGKARLGMLALNARHGPLVNPAAFAVSGDSVWMTTSRQAVKVALARRDPRAAFLVDAGERAVALEGTLEVLDLLSVAGGLRVALSPFSFAFGMAGYSLKNAPYMAGYLVDVMGIPREWWPQNRVVLRLRVREERILRLTRIETRRGARLPGPPAEVQAALGRVPVAYVSWDVHGSPLLTPCVWAVDGSDGLLWVPAGAHRAAPAPAIPAALVVELHHRFRATRMQGVCLRGHLVEDEGAAAAIAARYSGGLGGGTAYRLRGQRSSWWQGFKVTTEVLAQPDGARSKR